MEEKRYTVEESHLMFAKKLNGVTWDLLEKPARSAEEDDLTVHAAHASLYHWLQVGTPVNRQRGEWLVSRVYAVLGRGEDALHHAKRCIETTRKHEDLMEAFDTAFA